MKLSPIAYIILPSRFKILTKTKYALQKLPKYFKILQKWRNFAKSGHTTYQLPLARIREGSRWSCTPRRKRSTESCSSSSCPEIIKGCDYLLNCAQSCKCSKKIYCNYRAITYDHGALIRLTTDLFFLLQRRDLESIINQNLSGNRKQWILLNNLNRQHSRLRIAQKRARLPSVHAKKSASQVALIAAEYLIIDFVVQIR